MKRIILLEAVKEKSFLAFLSALGIFFVTPLVQSLTTPLAFEIWFTDLVQKPVNSFLYFVFSGLFGMFISLYIYSKNKCIDCKTDAKTGLGGTMLGFVIGVCPACFSFVGFLLPLGGSLFLTTYSPFFITLAIAIVLFSVYKMGGFKDTSQIDFKVNND